MDIACKIPHMRIDSEAGPIFIVLEDVKKTSKEIAREFAEEFTGKTIIEKGVRINCDLYLVCAEDTGRLYEIRLDLETGKQILYRLPLCGIYGQIHKLILREWSRFWDDNIPMVEALLADYLKPGEPSHNLFICEQCVGKPTEETHMGVFMGRQGKIGMEISLRFGGLQ